MKHFEKIAGPILWGIFTILIIPIVAWTVTQNVEHRVRNEFNLETSVNTARQQFAETCADLNGQDLRSCFEATIAGSRELQRAENDLTAQESMATWAYAMFWASSGSALLSLIGVFLIAGTLIYTRSAAQASEGMLKEAKNTTNYAYATLTSQRAWMACENIGIEEAGAGSFDVFFKWTNAGQSPALKSLAQTDFVVVPFAAAIPEIVLSYEEGVAAGFVNPPIGPGLSTMSGRNFISAEVVEQILTNTVAVYARSLCTYFDIFSDEEKHTSIFVRIYAYKRPGIGALSVDPRAIGPQNSMK